MIVTYFLEFSQQLRRNGSARYGFHVFDRKIGLVIHVRIERMIGPMNACILT